MIVLVTVMVTIVLADPSGSPATASDPLTPTPVATTTSVATPTPTPDQSGGATGTIDTPATAVTPTLQPPTLPRVPSRTHVTFCSGSNLKPSTIISLRPEVDCGFLLAIRSSLRGDATTGLEAWTDATRFDRWPEVTVNGSFRVTGITITADHGLGGTLSPYLSRLDYLTSLTIANNDLTGSIPAHLGHLSGLTRLDFGDNALTGEIPGQVGHLARLEHLDLGGNTLTGAVPEVLGRLTNLTHLDLSGNVLSGAFPRELAHLTSLETLNLGGGNAFTGCIPPSLRQVASNDLASLNLPDCHPCETPGVVPDPGNNPDLVRDCTALLTAKAALSERRAALLDWSGDRAITTWTGVTVTGTPPRVTALTLARTGGRESGGTISPALGDLDALTSLTMSWNKLRGPIPPELGKLSKLETLLLNRNQLSGPIPAELGNLSELRVLSLTSNFLTGAIPTELGNLAKLQALHLNQNRLSGRIPFELANLRELQALFLAENAAAGCIPHGLRDVANNDLDRYSNADCTLWRVCRSGIPVPNPAANPRLVEDCEALLAWRDTLAGTATLDWSAGRPMTSWTGVTTAGTPRRVTKLHLANAGLTGEISGLVGDLEALMELRLNGNSLTGAIPSKVAMLSRLTHVYLTGNAFTGCVPPSLPAVTNHDLASLGLLRCGAPVDVSDGNPTLTAGTYQVTWEEDDPPLVFEVPTGLQVRVEGWVLQGPGEIGLLLQESNSDSFLVLAVYEGREWSRYYSKPEDAVRLGRLYDRVVESAWISARESEGK